MHCRGQLTATAALPHLAAPFTSCVQNVVHMFESRTQNTTSVGTSTSLTSTSSTSTPRPCCGLQHPPELASAVIAVNPCISPPVPIYLCVSQSVPADTRPKAKRARRWQRVRPQRRRGPPARRKRTHIHSSMRARACDGQRRGATPRARQSLLLLCRCRCNIRGG